MLFGKYDNQWTSSNVAWVFYECKIDQQCELYIKANDLKEVEAKIKAIYKQGRRPQYKVIYQQEMMV
jgi:hypothetical protein